MKNLTTEIKRVFLKLIYTKPIETINVSSICDELEIKRQTFYYHYRDIFELVDSIFEDYTNELINKFIWPPKQNSRVCFLEHNDIGT